MSNETRLPLITPDSFDFKQYMVESEPQAKVLPADTWREELIDVVSNGNQICGARLPWAKTFENLRFREGEVTLVQGANGHGKSQFLGMACLGFAAQGERVCVASFEMTPKATLYRMMRQAAQNGNPPPEFVDQFLNWLAGRLWIYNQMGQATPGMLAAVIRYCATKLNIKHIVIDSLMRVVAGEDDYNQQKDFVGQLCALARDHRIHVFLVHHIRKLADENQVPGKFDSKGSGAVTDQVDNVLTVWRNKAKQREIETALRKGHEVSDEIKGKPDALLVCDKNRHGEWEGRVALWYHAPSLQYTSDQRCIPLDMMNLTLEALP
jgi:twinkle protein